MMRIRSAILLATAMMACIAANFSMTIAQEEDPPSEGKAAEATGVKLVRNTTHQTANGIFSGVSAWVVDREIMDRLNPRDAKRRQKKDRKDGDQAVAEDNEGEETGAQSGASWDQVRIRFDESEEMTGRMLNHLRKGLLKSSGPDQEEYQAYARMVKEIYAAGHCRFYMGEEVVKEGAFAIMSYRGETVVFFDFDINGEGDPGSGSSMGRVMVVTSGDTEQAADLLFLATDMNTPMTPFKRWIPKKDEKEE